MARLAQKTDVAEAPGPAALTIRELTEFLCPGRWSTGLPPPWPPDTFALVGALLHRSGAYCRVLDGWPPVRPAKKWEEEIRTIGRAWRESSVRSQDVPARILEWWQEILARGDRQVPHMAEDKVLCDALLQLFSTADEASTGVRFEEHPPTETGDVELFRRLWYQRLQATSEEPSGATLCREVHWSKVRVLPKVHTPQSGLTIRSLSQNLALCNAGDARPRWYAVPSALKSRPHGLNLLVIPWPKTVSPAHFLATQEPGEGGNGKFGLFAYAPKVSAEDDLPQRVERLLQEAERRVGKIDGVIFPELALTRGQHGKIRDFVVRHNAFLVSGVRPDTLEAGRPGGNSWILELPIGGSIYTSIEQRKHHRWKLDRSQVVQYGLGGRLDPTVFWWEHIPVGERDLWFVTLRGWLTLCVLICEDLARQEPIAEITRAVGPNLVIALLMDGPQLASRWPGRYATVLADDPGSSVLTLTSLGMAELSRPQQGSSRPRVVALWKDAKYGNNIEIELPSGAEAVVLSLAREFSEELTADGRSDYGAAGFPTLTGIHAV
jgi:hypothetical protein